MKKGKALKIFLLIVLEIFIIAGFFPPFVSPVQAYDVYNKYLSDIDRSALDNICGMTIEIYSRENYDGGKGRSLPGADVYLDGTGIGKTSENPSGILTVIGLDRRSHSLKIEKQGYHPFVGLQNENAKNPPEYQGNVYRTFEMMINPDTESYDASQGTPTGLSGRCWDERSTCGVIRRCSYELTFFKDSDGTGSNAITTATQTISAAGTRSSITTPTATPIRSSTLIPSASPSTDPCKEGNIGSGCPITYEYFQEGNALFFKGNYADSIVYFDKILEIDPNNTGALYFKCLALEYLKRYDEAFPYIDKAISIHPNDAALWNMKGGLYLSQKKYELALQSYDKALELKPGEQYIIENRKVAEKGLEDLKSSQTSFGSSSTNPASGFILAGDSKGHETQMPDEGFLPYTSTIQRNGNQIDLTLSGLNLASNSAYILSKDKNGKTVGYIIPVKIQGVRRGDQIAIHYDDPVAWHNLDLPVGYFRIDINRKVSAVFPSDPNLQFTWRSPEGKQGQGISGVNSIEVMSADKVGYPSGTDTLTIDVKSLGKDWWGIFGPEIESGEVDITVYLFNSETYGRKVFSEAYEKSKQLAAISAL
jgi:tetratricopeptide (TPR) repeat protein